MIQRTKRVEYAESNRGIHWFIVFHRQLLYSEHKQRQTISWSPFLTPRARSGEVSTTLLKAIHWEMIQRMISRSIHCAVESCWYK